MSTHHPECEWNDETRVNRRCICDRLRACEQRITAKYADASALWGDGYEHGVQAARDAVDSVPPIDQRVDDNGLISLVYDKGEALAAIDALREEKS